MVPMLEVKNVTKSFGGLTALDSVSLHVDRGEILGLIGPNGSGKTTLFNVISGVHRCNDGKVLFKGEDVTGLKPHVMAQKGVMRTFQHMALWKDLTVMQGLRVALHLRSEFSRLEGILRTSSYRSKEKKVEEEAMRILEFVDMVDFKDYQMASLSQGYRRTIGLGIGVATNPLLLLLDEPFAALNPERVVHIMALLKRAREQGTTMVIVEHNMKAIFDTCTRIVVLNAGRNIAEGLPHEIRDNEEVIAAYLGGRFAAKH